MIKHSKISFRNRSDSSLWLLVVVLALFPTIGFSDLLAAWDVAGIDVAELPAGAPYEVAATASNATGLVRGRLTLGAGVNPSTTAGQYGFKVSEADEQSTLSGAIQAEHYIQFSLTVDSGYQMDLQSLELNGQASASGCSNVVLMSSIDGFNEGNELESFFPANQTGGLDTTLDLTGLYFTNVTGTVDFRLYGWNSSTGNGITYIRNLAGNDLVINGSIAAIPEPAVLGLTMFIGIGSLAIRRWFN